jgi:hypothetical protein
MICLFRRLSSGRATLSGLAALAAGALLSSCATSPAPIISRYPNPPIRAEVASKYVDDDSPPEYLLRFRNVGRQIVSFDYTVSDQPNVPHIDRDGPNSGFIGNHYPGAEVEIPNPLKRSRVWVTLGTISYGKKAGITTRRTTTEVSLLPREGEYSIEPPPLPQIP